MVILPICVLKVHMCDSYVTLARLRLYSIIWCIILFTDACTEASLCWILLTCCHMTELQIINCVSVHCLPSCVHQLIKKEDSMLVV